MTHIVMAAGAEMISAVPARYRRCLDITSVLT